MGPGFSTEEWTAQSSNCLQAFKGNILTRFSFNKRTDALVHCIFTFFFIFNFPCVISDKKYLLCMV